MSFENVNPPGAKALIDSGEDLVLLDVRTVEEFDMGHVENAWNVPFGFRGPAGLEFNEAFAPTLERLFASDAKLVLL